MTARAPDPRKFTFDQRFDAPQPGSAASTATKAKRFYTPEELEVAKAEAFERGSRSIDALAARALGQIAEAMMTALRTLEQMAAEARAEALTTGVHAARRIADAALRRYPLDEIEDTIAHCLTQAPHEPRIVVRIAPTIAEALKVRIAALAENIGFAGRIVVTPDTGIGTADCRLEWTDGGVERDSSAIAARIDAVLERFIEADRRRAEEMIGA